MKNLLLKLFQLGALLSAFTLALFSSLALLGFASPLLDVFNHFQPFWFIGNLILLLLTGFFARTARFQALLMAICATGFLASAIIVVPEGLARFLPRAPVQDNAAPRYKMLTYNIFGMNYDAQRVIAMLQAEAPDIILLQEYFSYQRSFLHPVLVPDYPHFVFCEGEKRGNIALYAKEPFSTKAGDGCEWDANNRTARIVGHFTPPEAEGFNVVTTHLDWPIQVSVLKGSTSIGDGIEKMTARQVGQYKDLSTALDEITGPTLIAGDFNSTSWSYALRRFVTKNRLTRHTRNLFTFPKKFYVFGWRATPGILPLDQVLSRDGILVHDLYSTDAAGSDHAPVVTVFSVQK